MKTLFRLIVVLLAIVLLAGGYVGLVPGLSTIMGSNKPKDLGIAIPTDAEKIAAQSKTGAEIVSLPTDTPLDKAIRYEGENKTSFTFTSEEGTALLNRGKNKYFPFSNLQVRFNPDGSTEISGMVNMDKLFSFVQTLGFSTSDVDKALETYKLPRINMPFYAKGVGSATDNKASFSISTLQAGRLTVPANVVSENTSRVESVFDSVMNNPEYHFRANTLKNDGGKMVFDGVIPAKEFLVTQ